MVGTLIVQNLSKEHLIMHMASYIAISADVSPWGPDNFIRDAPRKWELSFALWEDEPIAYCIMSQRGNDIHIHQCMVAPYARGDGVGATLLSVAMDRGASTLKVAPENVRAVRFYENHGWVQDGGENGYLIMSFKR
jgi:ribosomal protein S18 acetylase RimI-like enzyme